MLLVVTYSQAARSTLRNVCRTHTSTVVRRFGRAALFEETEFAAFQSLRMARKHGTDVQLERTEPLNEFAEVPDRIRRAAREYENRGEPSTPYAKFAAGTEHPLPETMQRESL